MIRDVLARRLVVVTVRGASMLPTYRDGDRVLVRRVPLGQVRIGDVVVVERPESGWCHPPVGTGRIGGREWLLKRVAAMPGDRLPPQAAGILDAGLLVPPSRFAVLGDNAVRSYDSRQCGLIPASRLLGTVVRRLGQAR